MLGCCPKHLDENVSYRHVKSFFKVGGGQTYSNTLDKQNNPNNNENPNPSGRVAIG